MPVPRVSNDNPRQLVDTGSLELALSRCDDRFEVPEVGELSAISAAMMIWLAFTAACALYPCFPGCPTVFITRESRSVVLICPSGCAGG